MKRYTWMTWLITGLGSWTLQAATGAYLGVSTLPVEPGMASHLDLPAGVGLQVQFVDPEGALAGLVEEHDILHKLDGQMLINHEQLAVLVRAHQPGDSVKIALIHKGLAREVSATLLEKELPEPGAGPELPSLQFPPPTLHAFPFGADPFGSMQVNPAPAPGGGLGLVMPDLQALLQQNGGFLDPSQLDQLMQQLQGMSFQMDPAQGRGFQSSVQSESTASISANGLNLTVKDDGTERHLLARDADGKVLYDGPINTEAEKNALSDEVRELLDSIRMIHQSGAGGGLGSRVHTGISVMPGSGNTRVQRHSSSHSSHHSEGMNVSISNDGNGARIKVTDQNGEVIYQGPYQTDEDKANVPESVRKLLPDQEGPEKFPAPNVKRIRI